MTPRVSKLGLEEAHLQPRDKIKPLFSRWSVLDSPPPISDRLFIPFLRYFIRHCTSLTLIILTAIFCFTYFHCIQDAISMMRSFATLLLTAALAAAAPRASAPAANATAHHHTHTHIHRLLVGGPGQILTADFDGHNFSITGRNETAGSAPSWLLYDGEHETDLGRVYAVDENAADLQVFSLQRGGSNNGSSNGSAPELTWEAQATGSSGVVFLALNRERTRMVGAGYGAGAVDVWNVSSSDAAAAPQLLKTVNITGSLGPGQTAHHPHQALLDPRGLGFFVVNDLGGDRVLVLDGRGDAWNVTNEVALPAGSGPRHGGFLRHRGRHYYALACELSSRLFLFGMDYDDAEGKGLTFTPLQSLSTYGAAFPPANATSAAAGELVVARNRRDVYVSNRDSGNATDSIAHFRFEVEGEGEDEENGGGKNATSTAKASLRFVDTVSSGGVSPRMFSLSRDERTVFVANQAGANGLVALRRCRDSGRLDPTPVAVLPSAAAAAPALAATPSSGPEFVREI
ncbi:putative isomerase YbhE [Xylariaceae sp. FL0804]|nr:putative isomerase YbhE [Xylariaceae sp. FL0804]